MTKIDVLSPLAVRMRLAAATLEDANERINGVHGTNFQTKDWNWRPSELRTEADHVEAEDREAAELEKQVEELAALMYSITWPHGKGEFIDSEIRDRWLDRARKVIDAGWRKEDVA